MLKCDYAGCEKTFHVQCAREKGCHLNMDNIYYVNRSVQQQSVLRDAGGLLADVPGLGMVRSACAGVFVRVCDGM